MKRYVLVTFLTMITFALYRYIAELVDMPDGTIALAVASGIIANLCIPKNNYHL